MRLLSKAEVMGLSDRKTEDVPVPEWGEDCGVRVQSLSCAEHKQFTEQLKGEKDDATVAANLLVRCCVDEDGALVFGPADVKGLLARSAVAVKRIARAAMKLNGLLDGAAEDARKNS